jgi:hypothetical protein
MFLESMEDNFARYRRFFAGWCRRFAGSVFIEG